ncbi:capping complex subunit for YIEGIA [Virgibacillus halodenitrificans]|jgi:hypothetical protein|uniref:Uncharacterized protein n=1 Tax=Virgibacillus halodenitrificans TaxID=1482 RepID=A0AAC9IZG9_VIRHA|nr:hypothetical protein [Virgibacillus halodenitrificans]APC48422.1 hypothetical protein BME96_09670 [Virgibacillus halodenitrificans]MBD1222624.1 hypothetical protein [Virgibacillus halodenitrificans]MCG1028291.1 hypothetical protein [Virgibacillus halodenitrificans]MCJ0930993.1 hypothetical protein [Virgibacillus halodenitrificans]MEC2160380.1 hypothetical protein [Virgibacillus halodenitrificans]
MKLEKAILAVVTTDKTRISGGAPIFICDNRNESEALAANLEAITDGIAHSLSDDLFIIVKH